MHLFKNFPQFVLIHTVKDLSTVSETVVDVFSEIPLLFLRIYSLLINIDLRINSTVTYS